MEKKSIGKLIKENAASLGIGTIEDIISTPLPLPAKLVAGLIKNVLVQYQEFNEKTEKN
jgi:hypothetical protein